MAHKRISLLTTPLASKVAQSTWRGIFELSATDGYGRLCRKSIISFAILSAREHEKQQAFKRATDDDTKKKNNHPHILIGGWLDIFVQVI